MKKLLNDPERFVPEIEDGVNHVRNFEFLGDAYTSVRLASKGAVVTTATELHWERVEAPPELFELRRRLALDYGKLDYVLDGSNVVLLDVNKTMGATAASTDARVQALRRTRAARRKTGILAALPCRRQGL